MTEKCISTEAKCMRKLREKRVQLGLCSRCGKKLDNNYTKKICQNCKSYFKENEIKRHMNKDEIAFILFMKKKTPPKGEFGVRLKALMLKNIEPPLSLARSLNVSTSTVNCWLYGKHMPSKSRWQDIADHYNCSIDDLGL